MPRTVEIIVPQKQTDQLIAALRDHDGLVSLQLQRNGSLHPPGDVITAAVITQSLQALARLLDAYGVGQLTGTSLSTNQPLSILTSSQAEALALDGSEATWEEMETVIGHESNPTGNTLAVMVIAGVVAVVGLATNAVHLVVGAMLIAPGFEPILRIGLGLTTGGIRWQRGLSHTGQAYAVFVAAAVVTAGIFRLAGTSPLGGGDSYLPDRALVSYWTTFSWPSLLVSAVASVAGAVVVAANRSVLTSGVMVALALIPGAALVPMGIVAGDLTVAGLGAARWAVDAALVVGLGGLVFAWKQRRLHQRPRRL